MADLDKFLATFRINLEEWKDFMAQAKAEGKSASAVLVEFIQWYRAGNRIAGDTKESTNLDNLTVLIDERIKAKLGELETPDSQPHIDNLDRIQDKRDRNLESRLLSILETMLEDKLQELQDNIRHIESALDNRIDKLSQALAAQQPVCMETLAPHLKVEVETMDQQEREKLLAQISALQSENESLLQQNQELQRELSNVADLSTQLPDLSTLRSGILKSLTTGTRKVATTSPQYKTAARVLDRFIEELQKSTPISTPAPDHITHQNRLAPTSHL